MRAFFTSGGSLEINSVFVQVQNNFFADIYRRAIRPASEKSALFGVIVLHLALLTERSINVVVTPISNATNQASKVNDAKKGCALEIRSKKKEFTAVASSRILKTFCSTPI
jgi:hypothetical protein